MVVVCTNSTDKSNSRRILEESRSPVNNPSRVAYNPEISRSTSPLNVNVLSTVIMRTNQSTEHNRLVRRRSVTPENTIPAAMTAAVASSTGAAVDENMNIPRRTTERNFVLGSRRSTNDAFSGVSAITGSA
jgi:hypothetical protein